MAAFQGSNSDPLTLKQLDAYIAVACAQHDEDSLKSIGVKEKDYIALVRTAANEIHKLKTKQRPDGCGFTYKEEDYYTRPSTKYKDKLQIVHLTADHLIGKGSYKYVFLQKKISSPGKNLALIIPKSDDFNAAREIRAEFEANRRLNREADHVFPRPKGIPKRCYPIYEEDGALSAVLTERYEGDLEELLDEAITIPNLVDMANQAMEGFAFMLSTGCVDTDRKTGNMLYKPNGGGFTVHHCDFGAARFVDQMTPLDLIRGVVTGLTSTDKDLKSHFVSYPSKFKRDRKIGPFLKDLEKTFQEEEDCAYLEKAFQTRVENCSKTRKIYQKSILKIAEARVSHALFAQAVTMGEILTNGTYPFRTNDSRHLSDCEVAAPKKRKSRLLGQKTTLSEEFVETCTQFYGANMVKHICAFIENMGHRDPKKRCSIKEAMRNWNLIFPSLSHEAKKRDI